MDMDMDMNMDDLIPAIPLFATPFAGDHPTVGCMTDNPQFQFDFSSTPSRDYFQSTESTDPVNQPGNVTGDTGLVYTSDLLELHNRIWSLSDDEVMELARELDMPMDDLLWRVWVRRMMACVYSPIGKQDLLQRVPSPDVSMHGSYNGSAISDLLFGIHDAQKNLFSGYVHSNDILLSPIDIQASPSVTDSLHPAQHDLAFPESNMINFDPQSPDTEILLLRSPTFIESDCSTPSTVPALEMEAFTAQDYPTGHYDHQYDPIVIDHFERQVPSPPAHSYLGHPDTGAGGGYLYPSEHLSPSQVPGAYVGSSDPSIQR
ncbi:hypothetical protein L218DRAFT_674089 [Marasmius fiardii PR-910]|nr:hypothetical protein L218DRAFT_674089 [Marasmius fiardii PR-910]